MNIFIWQGYGNLDAFKAETAADINAVVTKIGAVTSRWGIDAHFQQMASAVSMFCSTNRVDRARREVVAFVRQYCQETDAFDLFEHTKVQ
jgi:hypothetical protein